MFQEIELSELWKKAKVALVDVRSPKEFADFHMPNSINIPLFDNEERAIVGTIYTKETPVAAKQKGLEIFAAKLPAFIKQFKQLNQEVVVYCWRGGMRSKVAATVLDLMDIKVARLKGGIRSYRQWTVSQLEQAPFPKKLVVLNGYTGSGKTLLLQRFKEQGYPVIDIEQMANHRGSVFGEVGLVPANQKTFDAKLVQALKANQQDFFLIEGESRRIGKVTLPESLFKAKEASPQLFIYLPLALRVEIILNAYRPYEHEEEIYLAFARIRKHIHTPIAKQIAQALSNQDFAMAVELLLVYYYDPLYEETLEHYPKAQQVTIKAQNLEEAYDQIMAYLRKQKLV